MSDGRALDDVSIRVAAAVAEIDAAQWDACAGGDNPFLSHAFFAAMEASGSASVRTGWQPLHLVLDDGDGRPQAIMPAYGKSHSHGEYVFDHGWADAWGRAGGAYYPKLLSAVPFTPVPGRRLLTRTPDLAASLIAGAEALVRQNGLSSGHATFIAPEEVLIFEQAGWLIRTGQQFHWTDEGFGDFDGFLEQLASRKRKAIRKERAAAVADVTVRWARGADIRPGDWDAMWRFYQDTGARKWGRPYLNRDAFARIGQTMADRVVLILAEQGGSVVAGALNLVGSDTLYGRYWGCAVDIPFLHFELCYYQAIDYALAHGLRRVEAGAQGEHKLARGYRPTPTYSAHFIADPAFRRAVADFVARERMAVEQDIGLLDEMTPFRKDG
jgi:hypothetical protein